MKIFMKTLIGFITLFMVMSCTSPTLYFAKDTFGSNPLGYTTEQIMTVKDAWRATAKFTYISDGSKDYWKSPKEFEADGGGDCEDFCIYFIYLLGEEANASMVFIDRGDSNHAIVKYEGVYIEPQCNGYYWYYDEIDIIKEYDYDYVMNNATRLGSKNISY